MERDDFKPSLRKKYHAEPGGARPEKKTLLSDPYYRSHLLVSHFPYTHISLP